MLHGGLQAPSRTPGVDLCPRVAMSEFCFIRLCVRGPGLQIPQGVMGLFGAVGVYQVGLMV